MMMPEIDLNFILKILNYILKAYFKIVKTVQMFINAIIQNNGDVSRSVRLLK